MLHNQVIVNRGEVVKRLYRDYNRGMEVERLHSWQVSPTETSAIQRQLAAQISTSSEVTTPRFITGVDISVNRAPGTATGTVVILNYPELRLIETKTTDGNPDFPYISRLLSFRKSLLTLAAYKRLATTPNLILVDRQGVAHPQRMGLTCHLGFFFKTPAMGCAKSPLYGSHEAAEVDSGSYAEAVDGKEPIGITLRTKRGGHLRLHQS